MKKQGQIQLISIKVDLVVSALYLSRMEELISEMYTSNSDIYIKSLSNLINSSN